MQTTQTSLRLSTELRDRIKAGADRHHESQADYIARALREFEHAEFLAAAAAQRYDDQGLTEARVWDQADLTPGLPE